MSDVERAAAAVRKRHVERKAWPLFKGDKNAAEDGYRHWCAVCKTTWPCDAIVLIRALEPSRA